MPQTYAYNLKRVSPQVLAELRGTAHHTNWSVMNYGQANYSIKAFVFTSSISGNIRNNFNRKSNKPVRLLESQRRAIPIFDFRVFVRSIIDRIVTLLKNKFSEKNPQMLQMPNKDSGLHPNPESTTLNEVEK